MNPYGPLTDDQLAEWHMLVTQNERLQRDLSESRKATEAAQAGGEDERRQLLAELNRRGDSIAKMGLDNVSALNMVRQNAGALVETLTALRRLLAGVEQYQRSAHDPAARRVLEKISAECMGVLAKYDVPF